MTNLSSRRRRVRGKAALGLLLAVVVTGALASPSSAATGSGQRRPLHLTKECSEYTAQADSFCTITSSNVDAITVGSRVVYLQGAVGGRLDSDIVLVVGPGDYALGHVTLDFATSTGEITISGGAGDFAKFRAHADVSALGGPDWAWDGSYREGGHHS
jgi:hypothetical protein